MDKDEESGQERKSAGQSRGRIICGGAIEVSMSHDEAVEVNVDTSVDRVPLKPPYELTYRLPSLVFLIGEIAVNRIQNFQNP